LASPAAARTSATPAGPTGRRPRRRREVRRRRGGGAGAARRPHHRSGPRVTFCSSPRPASRCGRAGVG